MLDYRTVLERLGLPGALAEFDPVVIGTPPLGIDVPGSDIDIACSVPVLARFGAVVRERFGMRPDFRFEPVAGLAAPAARAAFAADGWEIEMFCQTLPVREQWGVRHFEVERRLLALAPRLADAVRARKRAGMKTEPAFAAVLGLSGDPYAALLELESWRGADLEALAVRGLAALDHSA